MAKCVNPWKNMFPCRGCIPCRINRAKAWGIRISLEAEKWKEKGFITLTYDDNNLPKGGTLEKGDLQRFFKRYRRTTNKKIKYFACGEYGDEQNSFRPHYHIILLGGGGDDERDIIERTWGQGFIEVLPVIPETINYVTGYLTKKVTGEEGKKIYQERGLIPPFNTQSQGMGLWYALENEKQLIDLEYIPWDDNQKIPLPQYFRKKLKHNLSEKLILDIIKKEEVKRDNWRKGGETWFTRLNERRKAQIREILAKQSLKKKRRGL